MLHRRKKITVIGVILFIAAGNLLVLQCTPKNKVEESSSNAYVGDQSCKSCHKSEYHNWLTSDHFKAMQPANDSTVLGDFNNTTFTADGITSHFFKKDGKFFINTQGEDGKEHDY